MPPASFCTFENIRKPGIFWFFQGVWTENNDMKRVNVEIRKVADYDLKVLSNYGNFKLNWVGFIISPMFDFLLLKSSFFLDESPRFTFHKNFLWIFYDF